MLIEQKTKMGCLEAENGDGISLSFPNDKNRRGRVQKGRSPTLQTGKGAGVIIKKEVKGMTQERIRILTEREYWRLMGFSDEAFDKAAQVVSKTQLYKQAGNSIVVPVLEAIFNDLYGGKQHPKTFKIEEWSK